MVKKTGEKTDAKGDGMTSPYLTRPIRDRNEAEAEILRFRRAFHGNDAKLAHARKFGRISQIMVDFSDID